MQNPVIKKEFTISRGGDYYFLIDTMRKSPVLKVGRFVGVLLLLCNGKNNRKLQVQVGQLHGRN